MVEILRQSRKYVNAFGSLGMRGTGEKSDLRGENLTNNFSFFCS